MPGGQGQSSSQLVLYSDQVDRVSLRFALHQNPVDHLDLLEAESIQIIREVAAEFQNPVMLYSIGKDSSVMVRLAQKAFHPGKLPFPLFCVDTTYTFKQMIEFRAKF